jgi:hypothetical protein
MKKLIITAAIASLVGGASLAWANPEHHTGPDAKPVAGAPMSGHKHHKMHAMHHKMHCKKHCKHGAGGMKGMSGMSGGHDMMGKGGMDHKHMQKMHDHMGNGGMMGGGTMGGMAPSATPTPAGPK